MESRKFKNKDIQDKLTAELSTKLKENNNKHEWDKLKDRLTTAAAEICGKRKMAKKRNGMTEDIFEVMKERRNFKHNKLRYVELTKEIRRMCPKAKKDYHKSLCNEIEELDRKHNPKSVQYNKDANK